MIVKTLTVDKLKQNINELIENIAEKPQVIVGVLNGAKTILEEFKKSEKYAQSQFVEVKLQRKSERIKRNNFTSTLLKKLPYFVLDELRKIESKRAASQIKNIKLSELSSLVLPIEGLPNRDLHNILILDDALDTGKTMYVIKSQLHKKYPNAKITTAVIAWTIEQSIVQPDYYIYKNTLVRYPWSKDYKI